MRIVRMAVSGVVMGLTAVATVGAQEQRPVGITMGYPASVGVLLRVSDTVAIRPELSISGGDSDATGSAFISETNGWALGTGVSALFYLRKFDDLRTYVVPRFTYARTSNTTSTSSFTNSENTSTTTTTGLSGSFGAQYSLGDRFAVFGEVGFGFTHSTGKSNLSLTTVSGNNWGSRAGVGVIFFP